MCASLVLINAEIRWSSAHKGGNWAVMTARDYYITARHEIDPLYTNKSQRRLYLKCFLITWYNCCEEKTNEGCVYGTVGLLADGNLWQQPGNGELWPTGITCSLSSWPVSGLRLGFMFTLSLLVPFLSFNAVTEVRLGAWRPGGGCLLPSARAPDSPVQDSSQSNLRDYFTRCLQQSAHKSSSWDYGTSAEWWRACRRSAAWKQEAASSPLDS